MNRSHIDTFADLDQNYQLLVERMRAFDAQATAGSFPIETMRIYVGELRTYIDVIDAEKTRLEEEIEKAKTYEDQSLLGVLSLNLQKLTLIEANIKQTYTKRSTAFKKVTQIADQQGLQSDGTNTTSNIDIDTHASHPFTSVEHIARSKALIEQMQGLLTQYNHLTDQHLHISLDDTTEHQIEQDDSFLEIEHHYLTSVVNMLTKVEESLQTIATFPARIRRTWIYTFPQSRYIIGEQNKEIRSKNTDTKNNKDTDAIELFSDARWGDFKRDYTAFLKTYTRRYRHASAIIKRESKVNLLLQTTLLGDLPTQIHQQIKKTYTRAMSHDIAKIHNAQQLIERDVTLDHLLELVEGISRNPFSQYNHDLLSDPTDTDVIAKLTHAQKLGKTYQHLKETYTSLTAGFSYTSRFERKTIEQIISSYFLQLRDAQLMLYAPTDVSSAGFDTALDHYTTYLKDQQKQLTSRQHTRSQLQTRLDQIEASLAHIASYTYRPFDSLQSISSRYITLPHQGGVFGTIRQRLIQKLERTYTSQYEALMQSAYATTRQFSSSRRRGSNGLGGLGNLLSGGSGGGGGFSFGGGGGGGRSSGGGRGFSGGGWSGSGGTSW